MRIEFFAFIVEVILVVTAVYNPLGKQVSLTKQTNKEITKPSKNRPSRTRTPVVAVSGGLLDTFEF